MNCPLCGSSISAGAVLCGICGHTLTATAPPPRYAGFLRRAAAACIDLGVLLPAVLVMAAVFFTAPSPAERDVIDRLRAGMASRAEVEAVQVHMSMQFAGMLFFYFVLGVPYFILTEISGWQGTVGKRALGLKVTDKRGRRLRFGGAALRYACRPLSVLPACSGLFMAGFTARKQALHDLISGCFVVRA